MIKIIERHTNHIPKDPRYRVECSRCGTIFECNKSDMYKKAVEQGFWDWFIGCPVCARECTNYYNEDQIEEI
jgi:hypothetical protein